MFHVGFGHVKTLAIRNKLISKLYQLSGHAIAPAAYRILCVRFTSFVRQHDTSGSAVGATLDTGGWLALARPGLSPGKMRQAYLGAITSALNGASKPAKRGLRASVFERAVRRRHGPETGDIHFEFCDCGFAGASGLGALPSDCCAGAAGSASQDRTTG